MNKWEFWLKQARRFLEAAKNNLNNNFHETAYYLALHAGELAIKTVLIRCGVFKKEDEIHNMLELTKKIEKFNCLPSDVLIDVKKIVEPPGIKSYGSLSHVDVGYQDPVEPDRKVTIDCEAQMTSKIRYPVETVPPYQYISPADANNKVWLSDALIKILELNFNL